MSKTHYRKVFKSDHLGTADLEDFIEEKKPLIFTINQVKQEYSTKVAGRKIDANIAYFKEDVKPLVLNATNSSIVKKLAGGSPFVEDWKGIKIELYIDKTVKMKGEVVGGVRIKPEAPKPISEVDLKNLKLQLIAVANVEQLTQLYNSNIKYQTSKEALELFKVKKEELKNTKKELNDGTN